MGGPGCAQANSDCPPSEIHERNKKNQSRPLFFFCFKSFIVVFIFLNI